MRRKWRRSGRRRRRRRKRSKIYRMAPRNTPRIAQC